jgi:hypothetical protein
MILALPINIRQACGFANESARRIVQPHQVIAAFSCDC